MPFLVPPGKGSAETLPTPTCAWQFHWTPYGQGNWIFPDAAYRIWYMPIDAGWREVKISGAYAKSRFFSFALYDEAPIATALADHLYDAQIAPDAGSTNPFAEGASAVEVPANYTVTIDRSGGDGGNTLNLHAETAWLLYRVYFSNPGQGTMGGVPLPEITVTDAGGQTKTLPPCETVNRRPQFLDMQASILQGVLEDPVHVPPSPDHIWFGPVLNPPIRILPNPDNKYMVSYFMSERRPDRIVVIRVKIPGFPDTFHGSSVWQPAPGFDSIDLRYWTMCVGELVSPVPIVNCAVDATTPIDEDGFATIVLSYDVLRPHWFGPDIAWVPLGDEQMSPKTIFLRYLLASENFPHSIQKAVAAGCGAHFNFPVPPSQEAIREAGQCSQKIMGDYFPVAAWCDTDHFLEGGWKACFKQAGIE
ncbi:hypothetical protein M1105_03880 [Limibaculum sp. FT325]|uniref:hypothetical protein n=1 Tax=Thermohalobaculum sediminis TaxID=2939436 RepID=UPI0020BF95C4|nr:hypothetical protein [Limibaculum sediminis]MCL5776135.1 hypothetical protein [Limibaculum sediminis]